MSEPKIEYRIEQSGGGGEGWLSRDRVMAMVLIVTTIIAFYLCYLLLSPFLAALAWALALAVVSRPLHIWIERKVKRPGLAAVLTIVAISLLIIIPMALMMQNIVTQGIDVSKSAQETFGNGKWRQRIQANPQLAWLYNLVQNQLDLGGIIQQVGAFVSGSVMALLSGSVSLIVDILITLFSLFFFLRDRDKVMGMLRSLVPLSRGEANRVFDRISNTIQATVFGTLVVAAVQGALGGLMFWWLGLPGPVLWGAVMALLSVVPVLGAFIVWVPAAIILALDGEWTKAIILTAWGSVAVGFIDNLLYPMLVGKKLRLHTLPVFFSIIGGLIAFGTAGLILGPLVLAITDALIDLWHRRMAHGGTAEEPT